MRRRIIALNRILLVWSAVLVLGTQRVSAGPLEDGVAAYDRGDYAAAISLLYPLAEQGDALAQTKLGHIFVIGQNEREGARWFGAAAAQGSTEAQISLALLYYYGLGVPQDYVKAHMWANLAATGGDNHAATFRDRVALEMTQGQIAEAQRMAREQFEQFRN